MWPRFNASCALYAETTYSDDVIQWIILNIVDKYQTLINKDSDSFREKSVWIYILYSVRSTFN